MVLLATNGQLERMVATISRDPGAAPIGEVDASMPITGDHSTVGTVWHDHTR